MVDSSKPISENIVTAALTAYANVYYVNTTLQVIGLHLENDEEDSSPDVDLSFLLKDTSSEAKNIVCLILISNGTISAQKGDVQKQIRRVDEIIEEYCADHTRTSFDGYNLYNLICTDLGEENTHRIEQ